MEPVQQARQWYAEELRFTSKVRSPAVIDAFATVPLEQFVGSGPWRIKCPMDLAEYWTTDDEDPRHVYHDVLVALDEPRGTNNGQPSLWAYLFDHLYLAPGNRYFTSAAVPGTTPPLLPSLWAQPGGLPQSRLTRPWLRRRKWRSPIGPRSE